MKLIKKNWTKITSLFILISASADTIFDLLSQLGLEDTTINVIKLIGLLASILLPSIFEVKEDSKESNKIVGGAIVPSKGF